MNTRWLRHIGLPIAVVLLCLGLLAFGLMRLFAIEKTMRITMDANMVWVISQTEIEALRLDAALARYAPDDPAVGLRFDLLASRLAMIGEGPQMRYLDGVGMSDAIITLRDGVLAFDPVVTPLNAERVAALSAALEDLRQFLHRAANRSMIAEWHEISDRLDRYRTAVVQVILSLVLGGAMAAYLGWKLVADQRALLRLEEDRLRSVRLEQELEQERVQGAYWRDFAAIVSHQFRTPLAIIDSAAQRLLRSRKPLDEAGRTARLEEIRHTVADLSRLVDAALLAGQLDSESRTANCARHDLVAPMRRLIAELGSRHPGRDLRLESAGDPLLAWCDPGLATHTVMNLLENALRHSEGAVVLRLFARNEQIACAVVDSGPGIAPEELPHIFGRFRRGARPLGAGNGLGLWTARKLAELQAGSVEVESWPGRGSVFTLWLRAQAPYKEAA